MRSRTRAFACAVTVLLGASSTYGQGVGLRYRWTKGDDVRYQMTLQIATTMSGMPGTDAVTVDQTIVQVIRMRVEDTSADGTATLQQTFESMRMQIDTPTGRMGYDSASSVKPAAGDPISSSVASVLGPMIGESVTVVMAPSGAIQRFEGMSRILDKVAKSLSQDPAATGMLDQLKGALGDEAMGATMKQSFMEFPDHAVQIGESWNGQVKTVNPVAGAMTTSTVSTLKAIDGSAGARTARIAIAMTTKQESGTTTAGPLGPANVKIGDAKGDGETLFDVEKGRVLKGTAHNDMPMRMSMAAPDGSTLDLQMQLKMTMTMELVDK